MEIHKKNTQKELTWFWAGGLGRGSGAAAAAAGRSAPAETDATGAEDSWMRGAFESEGGRPRRLNDGTEGIVAGWVGE